MRPPCRHTRRSSRAARGCRSEHDANVESTTSNAPSRTEAPRRPRRAARAEAVRSGASARRRGARNVVAPVTRRSGGRRPGALRSARDVEHPLPGGHLGALAERLATICSVVPTTRSRRSSRWTAAGLDGGDRLNRRAGAVSARRRWKQAFMVVLLQFSGALPRPMWKGRRVRTCSPRRVRCPSVRDSMVLPGVHKPCPASGTEVR